MCKFVCCILCVMLIFGITGTALADAGNTARIENFTTTDIDGNAVELKDVLASNKVTMINIWTTWCGWCIVEMPDLEQINQRLKEKNCAIIGIMMDGTSEDIIAEGKDILKQNGVTYLNLLPPEKSEEKLSAINTYPTSFFVDSEGNILDKIVGAAPSMYESTVEDLLRLNINTADKTLPGSTVQLSVTGDTQGKRFTWSAEGKDVTIDEKTGALTIPADAEIGTEYIVTARSQEGDEIQTSVYVNDGIMSGQQIGQRSRIGYTLPHLSTDGWESMNASNYTVSDILELGGKQYQALGALYTITNQEVPGGFAEDPEAAHEYLDAYKLEESEKFRNVQQEIIEIDGHPALLRTYDSYEDGIFFSHRGTIDYPRNTVDLYFQLISIIRDGGTPESIPTVTMADLKTLASRIRYDESKAVFTRDNAALTITAKDDPVTVTAGKNIQFKAEFADKENISKKNKNDAVTWMVVGAENGAEVPGVTISDKGQLKVDKALGAPVNLIVKATSPIFKTETEYRLSAIPIITNILLDPAEVFFYTGTEAEQTVKATLEPDTVPATGITWKAQKDGIVEIKANDDGTAMIKPVAAGKTTITVAEPSGKKVRMNASVVAPVEQVELKISGKQIPGGKVNVKETLIPKNVGNKKVEWSLNVGENVATINEKGQITISKEATPGTKIIITCKAVGAPEPVVATAEFEVTEK